jgi:DNA-binding MarR family transcriptional regulator
MSMGLATGHPAMTGTGIVPGATNRTYHRPVADTPAAVVDAPTRWLDEREAEAWRAVRELGQPLWAALGREIQRDSGLSIADYEVLVVLSGAPDGVLPYRELARSTEWEKSRLSHHVTRMEQRGLVARQECPDDARAAHILLTPAGRQAIERAAPGHVAEVRRLLIDSLSQEQLDLLAAIGRDLRARLSASPAAEGDADTSGVDDCQAPC